jgi:hypothetical protein
LHSIGKIVVASIALYVESNRAKTPGASLDELCIIVPVDLVARVKLLGGS